MRRTSAAVLASRRLIDSRADTLRLIEVRQRPLDVLQLAVGNEVSVRLDYLARLDLEEVLGEIRGLVVSLEVPVLVGGEEDGRQSCGCCRDGRVENGVVVETVGDLRNADE